MKRTTHFLLFLAFSFFIKTVAIGQILRGRVFQYMPRELGSDSVALAGVQVSVLGKLLRTQTKVDGSFQLFLHGMFENEKIQIIIEKKGWRVLNDTVLKTTFRVNNGIVCPTILVCSDSDFLVLKIPFHLSNFIQKTYQKRMALLNRDWTIFSRSTLNADTRLKNISDRKEELWKRQQFLLAHTSDLSKRLSIDSQFVTDKLVRKMASLMQEGKVEEASNCINESRYKACVQKHLESPRDTQRWSELCLLAFLKAQCAMLQFNAAQADYYFNESFGLYDPQEFLNVPFYDAYIQFLMAFGESQKAFETIQTLLIRANMRQNTEGVAYAYAHLQTFYFDKKRYDLAQKVGQKALVGFDTLIQKHTKYNVKRNHIIEQLAFVYAQQGACPLAVQFSEKALLSTSDVKDLPKRVALRMVLAEAYQKMYEQTGEGENRQKGVLQLSILEKEFAQTNSNHPSVKKAFEQFKNMKSYIEDINKPRFLEQRKEIWTLETAIQQYKTTAQTIYYRSKIIESIQKLNSQLPKKNAVLNLELIHHYQEQAFAQIEQKNFREVEANARQALLLDATDDNMIALLATAQWLQNKKPLAQLTYKTVKDNDLILKIINDFEKKGIQKGVLESVRLDFGSNKQEL
jgi:tetratricopeptide (TPR) repeat protein